MKYLLLLAFLLTASFSAAYERNKVTYAPYRTVHTGNGFLSLTFAPDQLGRLAVLKLKKNGMELTDTFKLQQYTETPLFSLSTDNFQGIRELFWRKSLAGVSPMKIKSKSADTITFETKSYGGSNLGLRRRVRLEKAAFIVNFESVFTNNGKGKEKFAVWLNLQGAPPAKPVIPVPGRGSVPLRGMQNLYHRPFIFTGAGGNSNLPCAEEWAGFRLPGRKTVWIMESKGIKNGGFFYSWGNQDHRAPIRTVEPVFPEIEVAPGQKSAPVRYRLLVFPGLENINALAGNTALELRRKDPREIEMLFCHASDFPKPLRSVVTLRDKKGREICKESFLIPPGKAGSVFLRKGKCSGKAAAGTLHFGDVTTNIYFEKGE